MANETNEGNTIQLVLSILGMLAIAVWLFSAESASAFVIRIFMLFAAGVVLTMFLKKK